ncbi:MULTISPECIES: universal stress protein [unclassified Microbacterium]|uniref:universal stress protein n=1 Tax=unclassified Microbacterium TaxID=2609290 RepID=UPI000D00ED89|nr:MULTISPECIES: universal stress protein [unclassified Microbacterium]PRB65280.1 universal stress protein UspA [Microbacterium sp. MYb45]
MENTQTDRIVVGVDGSVSSIDALRYAARIAAALHTPLEAVTTWTAPPIDPYLAIEWSPENDAEEVLDESIREAFGESPPDGLMRRTLLGSAARTLIGLSENCSMLVLGSRGHGGFVGMLLGSVSAACAEHAHCPVLIVHARQGITPTDARRNSADV